MSTKQEQAADQVKTEKVKLIAVHTHAGEQCKEGGEIEVTEVEKAWLIRHKRIAPPADQPQSTAKAKE